jgi:hypothetical protein
VARQLGLRQEAGNILRMWECNLSWAENVTRLAWRAKECHQEYRYYVETLERIGYAVVALANKITQVIKTFSWYLL